MINRSILGSISVCYSLTEPIYMQIDTSGADFGSLKDNLRLRLRFTKESTVTIDVDGTPHSMSAEQLFGLMAVHSAWQTLLLRKTACLQPMTARVNAAEILCDSHRSDIDGLVTVRELFTGANMFYFFPRQGKSQEEDMWRHQAFRGCIEQLQRSGIPVPNP